MDKTKLIEILDVQAGKVKETIIEPQPVANFGFTQGGRPVRLSEAYHATVTTGTFPQLLQAGLKAILFDSYAGFPNTSEMWLDVVPSSNLDEQYIEGSSLGKLPKVPQNGSYPQIEPDLDRAVNIANDKRGGILSISEELVRTDKTGIIRQITADLGRAMAYTEEDDAYTVVRTTANYTRTSTAGDNAVGNNYGTTTFSGQGLETAFSTLRTMKDRKSGRFLGVNPTMLICGVGVEYAAMQLLFSPIVGGIGDTDAVITFGTGTTNPWRGSIQQIVVSPFMGRYEWILCEPKKFAVKQVFWDLRIVSQTSPNDPAHFETDAFRYKVSKHYGVGMLNDRFAYYSNSTTLPTVD